MILWTDVSFHDDPPICAIAVVEEATGIIHVEEIVDEPSASAGEIAAVAAAFKIARRQSEAVVVRTDCKTAAKMTPPNGVKVQHGYRGDNLAHTVARRAARQARRSTQA